MTDQFPFPPTEPIDDLVRRAVGDPAPGREVVEAGMTRLEAAMARPEPTARRRPLLPRIAAVAGLAAAMVVAAILVLPDEVSALAVLAEVAESVAPAVAGDGDQIHRVSEVTSLASLAAADIGLPGGGDIAYLQERTVRTWESADQIRVETELGPRTFFDPAAEAAFLASPLARIDAPGSVTVSVTGRPTTDLDARDWPTSTTELRRAMEAYVSNEPAEVPVGVRLMGLAGNLLRDARIESPLRATVLRVLDGLDGVEVSSAPGTVTVSTRFRAPSGATAVTSLVFDDQAHLIRESEVWVDGHAALGVPPGTVVFDSLNSVPEVVD